MASVQIFTIIVVSALLIWPAARAQEDVCRSSLRPNPKAQFVYLGINGWLRGWKPLHRPIANWPTIGFEIPSPQFQTVSQILNQVSPLGRIALEASFRRTLQALRPSFEDANSRPGPHVPVVTQFGGDFETRGQGSNRELPFIQGTLDGAPFILSADTVYLDTQWLGPMFLFGIEPLLQTRP